MFIVVINIASSLIKLFDDMLISVVATEWWQLNFPGELWFGIFKPAIKVLVNAVVLNIVTLGILF